MDLKVDLAKIKSPRECVFTSIKLGDYSITVVDGQLVIKKGDKIIMNHINDDWYLEGCSINSIWKTLENHYEAIMELQK